jgi:hypothetical protein
MENNMIFGSWKARSLYRSGSLLAVVRELMRHKLYLAGVQEVRWDKADIARTGYYAFFLWRIIKIIQ